MTTLSASQQAIIEEVKKLVTSAIEANYTINDPRDIDKTETGVMDKIADLLDNGLTKAEWQTDTELTDLLWKLMLSDLRDSDGTQSGSEHNLLELGLYLDLVPEQGYRGNNPQLKALCDGAVEKRAEREYRVYIQNFTIYDAMTTRIAEHASTLAQLITPHPKARTTLALNTRNYIRAFLLAKMATDPKLALLKRAQKDPLEMLNDVTPTELRYIMTQDDVSDNFYKELMIRKLALIGKSYPQDRVAEEVEIMLLLLTKNGALAQDVRNTLNRLRSVANEISQTLQFDYYSQIDTYNAWVKGLTTSSALTEQLAAIFADFKEVVPKGIQDLSSLELLKLLQHNNQVFVQHLRPPLNTLWKQGAYDAFVAKHKDALSASPAQQRQLLLGLLKHTDPVVILGQSGNEKATRSKHSPDFFAAASTLDSNGITALQLNPAWTSFECMLLANGIQAKALRHIFVNAMSLKLPNNISNIRNLVQKLFVEILSRADSVTKIDEEKVLTIIDMAQYFENNISGGYNSKSYSITDRDTLNLIVNLSEQQKAMLAVCFDLINNRPSYEKGLENYVYTNDNVQRLIYTVNSLSTNEMNSMLFVLEKLTLCTFRALEMVLLGSQPVVTDDKKFTNMLSFLLRVISEHPKLREKIQKDSSYNFIQKAVETDFKAVIISDTKWRQKVELLKSRRDFFENLVAICNSSGIDTRYEKAADVLRNYKKGHSDDKTAGNQILYFLANPDVFLTGKIINALDAQIERLNSTLKLAHLPHPVSASMLEFVVSQKGVSPAFFNEVLARIQGAYTVLNVPVQVQSVQEVNYYLELLEVLVRNNNKIITQVFAETIQRQRQYISGLEPLEHHGYKAIVSNFNLWMDVMSQSAALNKSFSGLLTKVAPPKNILELTTIELISYLNDFTLFSRRFRGPLNNLSKAEYDKFIEKHLQYLDSNLALRLALRDDVLQQLLIHSNPERILNTMRGQGLTTDHAKAFLESSSRVTGNLQYFLQGNNKWDLASVVKLATAAQIPSIKISTQLTNPIDSIRKGFFEEQIRYVFSQKPDGSALDLKKIQVLMDQVFLYQSEDSAFGLTKIVLDLMEKLYGTLQNQMQHARDITVFLSKTLWSSYAKITANQQDVRTTTAQDANARAEMLSRVFSLMIISGDFNAANEAYLACRYYSLKALEIPDSIKVQSDHEQITIIEIYFYLLHPRIPFDFHFDSSKLVDLLTRFAALSPETMDRINGDFIARVFAGLNRSLEDRHAKSTVGKAFTDLLALLYTVRQKNPALKIFGYDNAFWFDRIKERVEQRFGRDEQLISSPKEWREAINRVESQKLLLHEIQKTNQSNIESAAKQKAAVDLLMSYLNSYGPTEQIVEIALILADPDEVIPDLLQLLEAKLKKIVSQLRLGYLGHEITPQELEYVMTLPYVPLNFYTDLVNDLYGRMGRIDSAMDALSLFAQLLSHDTFRHLHGARFQKTIEQSRHKAQGVLSVFDDDNYPLVRHHNFLVRAINSDPVLRGVVGFLEEVPNPKTLLELSTAELFSLLTVNATVFAKYFAPQLQALDSNAYDQFINRHTKSSEGRNTDYKVLLQELLIHSEPAQVLSSEHKAEFLRVAEDLKYERAVYLIRETRFSSDLLALSRVVPPSLGIRNVFVEQAITLVVVPSSFFQTLFELIVNDKEKIDLKRIRFLLNFVFALKEHSELPLIQVVKYLISIVNRKYSDIKRDADDLTAFYVMLEQMIPSIQSSFKLQLHEMLTKSSAEHEPTIMFDESQVFTDILSSLIRLCEFDSANRVFFHIRDGEYLRPKKLVPNSKLDMTQEQRVVLQIYLDTINCAGGNYSDRNAFEIATLMEEMEAITPSVFERIMPVYSELVVRAMSFLHFELSRPFDFNIEDPLGTVKVLIRFILTAHGYHNATQYMSNLFYSSNESILSSFGKLLRSSNIDPVDLRFGIRAIKDIFDQIRELDNKRVSALKDQNYPAVKGIVSEIAEMLGNFKSTLVDRKLNGRLSYQPIMHFITRPAEFISLFCADINRISKDLDDSLAEDVIRKLQGMETYFSEPGVRRSQDHLFERMTHFMELMDIARLGLPFDSFLQKISAAPEVTVLGVRMGSYKRRIKEEAFDYSVLNYLFTIEHAGFLKALSKISSIRVQITGLKDRAAQERAQQEDRLAQLAAEKATKQEAARVASHKAAAAQFEGRLEEYLTAVEQGTGRSISTENFEIRASWLANLSRLSADPAILKQPAIQEFFEETRKLNFGFTSTFALIVATLTPENFHHLENIGALAIRAARVLEEMKAKEAKAAADAERAQREAEVTAAAIEAKNAQEFPELTDQYLSSLLDNSSAPLTATKMGKRVDYLEALHALLSTAVSADTTVIKAQVDEFFTKAAVFNFTPTASGMSFGRLVAMLTRNNVLSVDPGKVAALVTKARQVLTTLQENEKTRAEACSLTSMPQNEKRRTVLTQWHTSPLETIVSPRARIKLLQIQHGGLAPGQLMETSCRVIESVVLSSYADDGTVVEPPQLVTKRM